MYWIESLFSILQVAGSPRSDLDLLGFLFSTKSEITLLECLFGVSTTLQEILVVAASGHFRLTGVLLPHDETAVGQFSEVWRRLCPGVGIC